MGMWVHLKMDGSIKVDSSYAAARGVLRNDRGEWIIGFNQRLGRCTISNAEL